MPVMALWGEKVFEVSQKRLLALQELETSMAIKKENKQQEGGGSVTEVKGFELQPIKFSVALGDAVGIDVRREWEDWKALVGGINSLYLAGRVFGPDALQLDSAELGDIIIDPMGRMRYAMLSLTFTEYADEGANTNRQGAYIAIEKVVPSKYTPIKRIKKDKKPIYI